MKFREYMESRDIFGFERERDLQNQQREIINDDPVNQFSVEEMINTMLQKNIDNHVPYSRFMNEIQWGNQFGAVKVEVDTGYTFYIKRLGSDKVGNPRWVTKKMFQLNRNGYHGLEEQVAEEVFRDVENIIATNVDSPVEKYEEFENLVKHVYKKLIKHSKPIFIPEGVDKIGETAYLLKFGIVGQGVGAPDGRRIEQNQLMMAYDIKEGTIRVFGYNIESPTGRKHEWQIMPNDLDLYFFPTQNNDEISECLIVHFKYF